MHKPAIQPLVYSRLFPSAKANDPVSFQAHITRNILPEVRSETACFYGPGDCLESQFPGLDYTNPAHRNRLVRFTWHRRLFRVFDELRLTNSEIDALCRWEGTKAARQKYERDNHCTIRDTTWDEVDHFEQLRATATRSQLRVGADGQEIVGVIVPGTPMANEETKVEDSEGQNLDEESEDELQQSIGVDLNRRLMAATEARARGEEVVLDADWEQWLKEAAERSESASLNLDFGPSQDPADHLDHPYGQLIPAIFSSNPTPQIRAVQARLPPPPTYPGYVPATPSAAPTGTAM